MGKRLNEATGQVSGSEEIGIGRLVQIFNEMRRFLSIRIRSIATKVGDVALEKCA